VERNEELDVHTLAAVVFARGSGAANGCSEEKGGRKMRIHFILNKGERPPALLADVEVHFEEGPLAGMKLVGCSVWKSVKTEGKVSVMVPSRTYAGPKGDKRHWELLRDSEGEGHKKVAAFKKLIRTEYLKLQEPPDHD